MKRQICSSTTIWHAIYIGSMLMPAPNSPEKSPPERLDSGHLPHIVPPIVDLVVSAVVDAAVVFFNRHIKK